jgi:hypothetical protein
MKEILTNLVPNYNIFTVSVDNRKGPIDFVLQSRELIDDEEQVIIKYVECILSIFLYKYKLKCFV